MVDLLQKNHKSESHRLNQKMRGLQLEKDDLEKAIQDLDLKLQVSFLLLYSFCDLKLPTDVLIMQLLLFNILII